MIVMLWRQATAILFIALLPVGCDLQGDDNSNNNVNGNDNSTGSNGNGNQNYVAPTGFENAVAAEFTEANFVFDSGSIETEGEVKIYDLGSLVVGDRVDVQCVPIAGGGLDPMVALFDAEGHRILWSDDVNAQVSNFIAAFQGNIRHDSSHYYLAVTSSIFPSTTGEYDLTVQLASGVDAPILIEQTIVLHWAAAEGVNVDELYFGDLAEFDATNVNEIFAGRTEEMKELILEIVQEDYADYNLTIVAQGDGESPEGNYSTIYFSPDTDMDVFARSDGVDFFNGNDMDNAILLLGAFDGLTTDFEAMSQGIANVVSREIGRLLGLMITEDVTLVMDKTESTGDQRSTLLDDRSFGIATLLEFPIGLQNSPLLLEETVGLR